MECPPESHRPNQLVHGLRTEAGHNGAFALSSHDTFPHHLQRVQRMVHLYVHVINSIFDQEKTPSHYKSKQQKFVW